MEKTLPLWSTMRSRKAQVWIHAKSTNEILLFKVVPTRGHGFQPVTGGVEESESFFQGAQRELHEETGLDPTQGKWIDLNYEFTFESRWGGIATERAYLFQLDQPASIQIDPKEHTEAKWFSVRRALSEVVFENQKKALQLAIQKIEEP